MNKSYLNAIASGIIFSGFLGTLAYAISANHKLKQISNKLNVAIDDTINAGIDIPEQMIEESLDRCIECKYSTELRSVCKQATQKVRNDIYEQIKTVVNDEFDKQKTEVAKELRNKINSLDISNIRRQVIEEAKDAAAEKFKSDLDDILKKHNDELESVTKIYASIADRMGGSK